MNPFLIFGSGKGMKKLIPNIWERKQKPVIPGYSWDWEQKMNEKIHSQIPGTGREWKNLFPRFGNRNATLSFQRTTGHGNSRSPTFAFYVTNIARITKAALHKLPGKSSLNIRSVCPVWPACPFVLVVLVSYLSWWPWWPWRPWWQWCDHDCKYNHDHENHDDHEDHIDHEDHRICKLVGGCTEASWRLSDVI